GHDAFAALSRYGAAAMATIGQRHALSRAGRDMEQRRGQDPLTELLNRAGFELTVASILDRLVPGAEIRVIAVDLDGFNPIVAEAGWRAGDAVLREVGARVARACPTGAALARLDVDRFAIATDDPAVPDLASHLVDLLARPITTDVGTFTIRASIGQVITPDPSTPPLVAIEEAQRRSATARPRSIAEAGRR
ncbi:MAG: diguanylate cyclase, partial [Actinomycetota bacterium]